MSKVQGGMKCVKYLLFVFNFIFWLSGLLVLAVGLWLTFDSDTSNLLAHDEAPSTYYIAVYILLGVGGLMMIVGFFGCFGAVRESQCLLSLFFACLLIIFGAEITAGVFGFMNMEQIVEEVQKFYSSCVSDDNTRNGSAIATIYHNVLNCCGGPTTNIVEELCGNESSPECPTLISDFFKEKLHIIGYVGIGVAGVMILGMIFSMVLCCVIRNTREVI